MQGIQGVQGMPESPDAGDAGMLGMLVNLQCFLKVGQRGVRSPLQGHGCRGCFGVQNVWAGDAEEELGVQQNTSAVYPTGRVALALRARRHTAQLTVCCFQTRKN